MEIEKIIIKVYSHKCSCEHCTLLFLNPNSAIYCIICRLIQIRHDNDLKTKKSLQIHQNTQENVQKIMTFSGENKFIRIKLDENRNENFLIDDKNVRNYESASFFKKSLKIPAEKVNAPRSYFMSTISRNDDEIKFGGSYHLEFLEKIKQLETI